MTHTDENKRNRKGDNLIDTVEVPTPARYLRRKVTDIYFQLIGMVANRVSELLIL